MKTPKKNAGIAKKTISGAKTEIKAAASKPARKFDDDDDDDDFGEPLDEIGGFEDINSFDDDDDF